MECVMFEPWVKNVAEGIIIKMPELRDLFAMQALSAAYKTIDSCFSGEEFYKRLAEESYKVADAMLKARSKK